MTQRSTPAQQRAERKRYVKQGLQAGLGIVRASYEAARHMKKKHGSIYLKDDDSYWLHDIGLLPKLVHPPDDRPDQPPVVRGHRRR